MRKIEQRSVKDAQVLISRICEYITLHDFKLWCWRRLLRVPWTARKSNQLVLREINLEYSLKGLMLKLKPQYFGHLMRTANSLQKSLLLGKTEDRDCGQEIRGQLFLGRKAMTNLDSVLKSRDITLPAKVCIVKALIFPVLTYSCESWTVKKAECQRIDAFELWC